PDWNVWKNVHEAYLDEAIALSLGVDPQKIRKRGYPIDAAHRYDDETQEFRERLFLARRNRPNIGVVRQLPLIDPSVNLQLFARWAWSMGWQMPDAMIEIAGQLATCHDEQIGREDFTKPRAALLNELSDLTGPKTEAPPAYPEARSGDTPLVAQGGRRQR